MSASMKPSEALRKARELITPERAWIQQEMALSSQGEDLHKGDDPRAVCWCSLGAIEHEAGYGTSADLEAMKFLEEVVGQDVVDWNDAPERTHVEVLTAFDEAIVLAEAEGH